MRETRRIGRTNVSVLRLVGGIVIALLVVALSQPTLRAADASAVDVAKPEVVPEGASTTPLDEPADVTPDAVLEELPATEEPLTEDKANAPEALLDAALDAMDQAVFDLEGDSPTAKVVQDQQDAVDRLKELLAAASKPKSSSSKSSQKNQTQPPPGSSDEKQEKSESSDESGNGGRRADDESSTESSENVAGPTTPGSGVLAPGAKANSVWGHLPPREQEALLRSLSDNFLPEYEAQIRRYYEALAEKK